jgi:predicted naringenin-chalcone synthase
VPDLIEEDFSTIVTHALKKINTDQSTISHWCIHPGGKRVLEAIHKSLRLTNDQLKTSYEVLNEFGNLSSATILFVMKKMMHEKKSIQKLFGAAFGPGLTVETFTAHWS